MFLHSTMVYLDSMQLSAKHSRSTESHEAFDVRGIDHAVSFLPPPPSLFLTHMHAVCMYTIMYVCMYACMYVYACTVDSDYLINKIIFAGASEEINLKLRESQNAQERLKGENASLQGQITSLQGKTASLQGENVSLQGEITSLHGEITLLKETHEREITALKEQLRRALASNN
jgi:peptidoglycan hydrolase CwlO-like protein